MCQDSSNCTLKLCSFCSFWGFIVVLFLRCITYSKCIIRIFSAVNIKQLLRKPTKTRTEDAHTPPCRDKKNCVLSKHRKFLGRGNLFNVQICFICSFAPMFQTPTKNEDLKLFWCLRGCGWLSSPWGLKDSQGRPATGEVHARPQEPFLAVVSQLPWELSRLEQRCGSSLRLLEKARTWSARHPKIPPRGGSRASQRLSRPTGSLEPREAPEPGPPPYGDQWLRGSHLCLGEPDMTYLHVSRCKVGKSHFGLVKTDSRSSSDSELFQREFWRLTLKRQRDSGSKARGQEKRTGPGWGYQAFPPASSTAPLTATRPTAPSSSQPRHWLMEGAAFPVTLKLGSSPGPKHQSGGSQEGKSAEW